jgi:hypothetical protein
MVRSACAQAWCVSAARTHVYGCTTSATCRRVAHAACCDILLLLTTLHTPHLQGVTSRVTSRRVPSTRCATCCLRCCESSCVTIGRADQQLRKVPSGTSRPSSLSSHSSHATLRSTCGTAALSLPGWPCPLRRYAHARCRILAVPHGVPWSQFCILGSYASDSL